MPLQHRILGNVAFYRWGDHGKQYYYKLKNKGDGRRAKDSALRQGKAIHASGWREFPMY